MMTAIDESFSDSSRSASRLMNTREKLMRAALAIISEERGGLLGLSLREITRRIGVSPTAFYRHFPGMEDLGLQLIDDSGELLRCKLRTARQSGALENIISASVTVSLAFIRQQRSIFLMVARERAGGSQKMRAAIRKQISQCAIELASDLRLTHLLPQMGQGSLQRVASMGIGLVMNAIPEVLDLPEGNSEMSAELERDIEQQLHILFLGARNWQPIPSQ